MRSFAITALLVFAADKLSKLAVVEWFGLRERLAIDVLPPFLNLRMGWNRGVNFGLFANDAQIVRWGLVALAVGVSVLLIGWAAKQPRRGVHLALAGAVAGGALANALDRVIYGAVADFLNMSCCGIANPYTFNVADIGIFGGALGLVLFGGGGDRPMRNKNG